MATKKDRSLRGARNKIAGSKGITHRALTSGRYLSDAVAKRHPTATITQKSGSASWETRTARPTAAVSKSPDALLEGLGVEIVQATGPTRDDAVDPALRRLMFALMRHVKTLDLSEVERANGSMDAVAERMLASIPGANVLDDRVGPFYDTAGSRRGSR